MFWGLLLEEGKFYSQKVTSPFHISMAALETTGKGGSAVTVNCEQDGTDYILCTLKDEALYQQPLDLNFAFGEEIKFFLSGKGTVHLTGYVVMDDEDDDELDSEEEDEAPELAPITNNKGKKAVDAALKAAKKIAPPEDSDDDDSDEDSDEEETPIKSKKPAVPAIADKKPKKDGKKEEPAKKADTKKQDLKKKAAEEDSEDSDDSDEGEIDFKKLMAQVGSDDDSDDEDMDMDGLDDEEGEEEEDEDDDDDDDSDEEEDTPPSPKKKNKNMTPQVTPKVDSSKKDKKTPISLKPGGGKDKGKTPESSKKRKDFASPLVNGSGDEGNKKMKADEEEEVRGAHRRQVRGGVKVDDFRFGRGPTAEDGKYLNVHYVGMLQCNRKVFDSNTSGKGFKFRLGRGEVITGWDYGFQGMKVGGKREIIVPARLAYGAKGAPPEIPPNSDLLFEVELKAVS